eukprot:11441437-Prorocentrum_lima.AAC.1
MTSSLVGSEMCIRDSKTTQGIGVVVESLPLGSSCRWEALALLPPLWSVSYTHLTLPTICSV